MSQRQPDYDEQLEKQREAQSASNAEQTAHSVAASGLNMGALQRKEFGEFISTPSIDRDESKLPEGEVADLEQKLSAEFGTHTVLASISQNEWERQRWRDKMWSILVKTEYRPRSGPGHKCTGDTYRLLTGKEDGRPVLTPDRARQIDASMHERTMARSLAVGGRAYSGLVEVTAVSKSETLGTDSDAGGILGRLKAALGG